MKPNHFLCGKYVQLFPDRIILNKVGSHTDVWNYWNGVFHVYIVWDVQRAAQRLLIIYNFSIIHCRGVAFAHQVPCLLICYDHQGDCVKPANIHPEPVLPSHLTRAGSTAALGETLLWHVGEVPKPHKCWAVIISIVFRQRWLLNTGKKNASLHATKIYPPSWKDCLPSLQLLQPLLRPTPAKVPHFPQYLILWESLGWALLASLFHLCRFPHFPLLCPERSFEASNHIPTAHPPAVVHYAFSKFNKPPEKNEHSCSVALGCNQVVYFFPKGWIYSH